MDRSSIAWVLVFTAVWFVSILGGVGVRRWRAGGQSGKSIVVGLGVIGGPVVLAMVSAAVALSQPSRDARAWLIAVSVAVLFLPAGALTLVRVFQAVERTVRQRDVPR